MLFQPKCYLCKNSSSTTLQKSPRWKKPIFAPNRQGANFKTRQISREKKEKRKSEECCLGSSRFLLIPNLRNTLEIGMAL
ncbi:hypothetical protein P3S68_009362 [Capsicum galapagoense]